MAQSYEQYQQELGHGWLETREGYFRKDPSPPLAKAKATLRIALCGCKRALRYKVQLHHLMFKTCDILFTTHESVLTETDHDQKLEQGSHHIFVDDNGAGVFIELWDRRKDNGIASCRYRYSWTTEKPPEIAEILNEIRQLIRKVYNKEGNLIDWLIRMFPRTSAVS